MQTEINRLKTEVLDMVPITKLTDTVNEIRLSNRVVLFRIACAVRLCDCASDWCQHAYEVYSNRDKDSHFANRMLVSAIIDCIIILGYVYGVFYAFKEDP